jgi:hypothetical protein
MTQAGDTVTRDTAADSEIITAHMMNAGMKALRTLDLTNPVYTNRSATVRAIYTEMRNARWLAEVTRRHS